MSEQIAAVELAYMQGQADYEATLVESADAQPDPVEAAYMQGLADYESALVAHAGVEDSLGLSHQEAYVQGLADYEAALIQQMAAAGPYESEGQDAAREEAYQMGVARADAERFLKLLDSGSTELSAELRDAFDKGVADYQAAVTKDESTGEGSSSRSQRSTAKK